ncbi:MAG: formylglycine-generating enzyme family protein [Planctomycetota bacterium]
MRARTFVLLGLLAAGALLSLPRLMCPAPEPRKKAAAPAPTEPAPPEPEPEPPRPPPPTRELTGMVHVPAGKFRMGADEAFFVKTFNMRSKKKCHPRLKGKQKDQWWPILLTETPEHDAETEAYAIDRFEVTNAQYEVFLRETSRESVITARDDTLTTVATDLYGQTPVPWQMETIYWLSREKLLAVKDEVLESNEALVNALCQQFNVKSFDDIVEEKQIEAWAQFGLPPGIELTVYTRTVPAWERVEVTEEIADLPVGYVSGLDADAFAEWAGKHVPTEEEWEKAARGPEGFVYPWGDEWDPSDPRQRNWIHWSGTDSPPAPPYEDRPLPVDALPEGQSHYGCFHMLGNVMEWTSSYPKRYPGSKGRSPYFGNIRARVLRGLAYGDGLAYKDMELKFRNTARVLASPGGAIYPKNRWSMVGFRCAKYHTPARDVLLHAMRRTEEKGLLSPHLGLDPANGFGVERREYAPYGEEGRGKVFVRSRTEAVGFVPVTAEMSPYLGYVYWTKGLEVEGAGGDSLKCEDGYLVGVQGDRVAMFRFRIRGPERIALLPDAVERDEEAGRSATVDEESGAVRLSWKGVSFRLRIGALWKEEWFETE